MAGRTVPASLNEGVEARLNAVASGEDRSPSQVITVALKTFLNASPGARQAAYAIDGAASEDERRFVSSLTNRAMLKAYERVLDARNLDPVPNGADTMLASEEEIEAEAVRACRM